MSDAKLVVFLATHNRLETLARTVASFEQMTTPYELVIIDNGTSHPKCLDLLEQLSKTYRVMELGVVWSMQELTDHYNVALRDYYKRKKCPPWFAVTDADICFEGTHPMAFDAYIHLAHELRAGVGPHLRVDAGIPRGYPIRTMVIATQTWLTYRENMTRLHGIPHSAAHIDTTFHVFPRARQHKRLKMPTHRVGRPYDAMHLDWYVDIFNPSEEAEIYMSDISPVGSWGKGWLASFWDRYKTDPEWALELVLEPPSHDLHPYPFIASWMYQHGLPGPCDNERYMKAVRLLWEAVPDTQPCARYRHHWLKQVFDSDFSATGW